jgi:glycosyltransferase involved in cell wall biosynthesis
MQSVQATLLNSTIVPGETPIMIVSPDGIAGNRLCALLSLNVVTTRNFARIQDDLAEYNHYFSNKPARRLLQNIKKAGYTKPAEQRDKIRLLLEESADNGRLWGLHLDYDLFFNLELFNLSEAFYIFLYDDAAKTNPAHAGYLEHAANFAADHKDNCVVIHLKQVDVLPELILSTLPFNRHDRLVPPVFSKRQDDDEDEDEKEDKDLLAPKPEQIVLVDPLPASQIQPTVRNSVAAFDALNFIHEDTLLRGEQLVFALYYNGTGSRDALTKKLQTIRDYFVTAPELHIVCRSEEDKKSVQTLLSRPGFDTIKYNLHAAHNPVSAINQAIFSSKATIAVVDNLNLHCRYDALLQPFVQEEEGLRLSFGIVSESHTVHLSDFLTTNIIHDLTVFPKAIWQDLGGLDEGLDVSVMLWDFSIKALRNEDSFAVAIHSVANDAVQGEINESQMANLLSSAAYQAVITRHQEVFEENSRQLIKLFTQYLHRPQHEIKDLHQQISSLQTMQSHSRSELKAITDLSKALQKRIQILEDRWYYKLNAKIKRLKKIFFKKNTTGTGRLKKILTFLSFTLSKPGMAILRKVSKRGLKKLYLLAEDRPVQITYLDEDANNEIRDYNDWIRYRQKPEQISRDFKATQAKLTQQPKISIVMPVYNPLPKYLKAAIESVLRQDYSNWELCIADDCSPGEKIGKLLRAYAMKDSRIKVAFRKENGHISACSNSALELATGEYILFMDHDDLLSRDCFLEVLKHINTHPEHDIIYSDEDKVNEAERHTEPHFKPDWAPDSLLSRNYMGHVVVMKKKLVDEIGGFRLGFEGSQDYDLLLRATEATTNIGHIPKVLYHWRIHGKSAAQSEDVKPYAYIAAKKALEEALQRRGTPGSISYLSGLRGYRIKYDIPVEGKVSIIIPTKDHVKLLKNTVDSILHHTDYSNYEIIVLNNNSSSKEFFSLVANYSAQYSDRFRCIDCPFPFNFAKLMNIGAKAATGEYLLLLNNDVEIIHEDWLRAMVAYAQIPEHGAVGVKLLYPDDHIQHAGVIVGLGGVAGHAFLNAYKDDPGYFNYIQSVNNFSAVTAACLMCRKSLYDQVGGMDETLEVEFNDVDLCLKFVDAGYYNIYLPDVELYHYESATRGHPHQSRESWERHEREIKLFKAKWQRYIDHDPFFNPNLNIGAHDFSMDFSAGTPNPSRKKAEDSFEASKTPKSAKQQAKARLEERALLN